MVRALLNIISFSPLPTTNNRSEEFHEVVLLGVYTLLFAPTTNSFFERALVPSPNATALSPEAKAKVPIAVEYSPVALV